MSNTAFARSFITLATVYAEDRVTYKDQAGTLVLARDSGVTTTLRKAAEAAHMAAEAVKFIVDKTGDLLSDWLRKLFGLRTMEVSDGEPEPDAILLFFPDDEDGTSLLLLRGTPRDVAKRCVFDYVVANEAMPTQAQIEACAG